jgi:hypothetical protein
MPGARDDRSLSADSVSVENTIDLLRRDVQDVAASRAVQNLNSWQRRLPGADEEGSAAFDGLFDSLKTELTAGRIDAQVVGDILAKMGARTSQAADTASGGAGRRLGQLARVLTQTGERLTGGRGENSAEAN